MNDVKKTPRTQAKLPRGFGDRGPAEIAATERMLAAIKESYQLYGFEAVETPFIEYTEALGKFLPDLDRPNEGVFSFQDDDEQWLSLRYDLTAPLARFVAENYDRLPKPYRSYRAGYVFRNEKPGPGRFRQFMQFDADTVGTSSVAADAELCMMAADTLERLGVKRGDYVIKVNNRKVLDGLMESIKLGGAENVGRRLTVLRAIDKLDKFGVEGVSLLLGPGRKDESGDFTKGASLDADAITRVINFTGWTESGSGSASISGAGDVTLANFDAAVGTSVLGQQGITELRVLRDLIRSAGYEDRIRIDPSVVRGLEYYTGPVFEAELTFEVKDDEGRPVRFGSVGGGGRYDDLVARFTGQQVPATGISIGVSRLVSALKDRAANVEPLVVVLVVDKENVADSFAMARELRAAGIRAETYTGNKKFGDQLKYADRRGAAIAVIEGGDERAKGEVQLKDLALGSELAKSIESRADWVKDRAAQISVKRNELVAQVRKMLARS